MTASISLANAGTEKKKRNIPKWLYPVIYHRRKIAVVGIIIALLMVGMVAFCEPEPYENASGLGEVVMHMVDGIFGTGDIGKAQNILIVDFTETTDASGNSTVSTISVGEDDDGTATYPLDNISPVLTTVNDVFVNLGSAMLIIFWGASFISLMTQTQGQMVMEQMIRKFVLLCVGLALVSKGMTIVFGFTSFGTEIMQHLSGTLAGQNLINDELLVSIKNSIYEELTESDWTGIIGLIKKFILQLGYILRFAIPYLFCFVSGIVVMVVAWSRVVEIIILAVVSPVMFADIGDDRGGFLHTNAFRALRHVFALAMSGLLIYISLYLCSVITSSVVLKGLAGDPTAADIINSTGTLVILGLVRVGLVAKSTQLSRQLAGLA